MWIVAYDDCVAHCRALNGISDVSKKMRELEDRNFRTGWEGRFSHFWACFSMCAEQTPNIVEFRECMGGCSNQDFSKKPETKDDASEEQDKESAEAL